MTKIPGSTLGGGQSGTGGGIYTGIGEKAKNELGKKCEEEVLMALKHEYGEDNVQWLSGYSNNPAKNDHLGFDMMYKDSGNVWHFVEVKAFFKGSFFFSETALAFAKENKSRYHLYLVDDSEIHKILFANLLDEKNELKYDNDFFSIEINDYKFTRHSS